MWQEYWKLLGVCIYISLCQTLTLYVTFSKNRIIYVSLCWFPVSTTKFSTRGDLYIYRIRKDNFSMKVFVFGIDVSTRCGPLSKVDFIYFVWQYFESISSEQYAITLIPSNINSLSIPQT